MCDILPGCNGFTCCYFWLKRGEIIIISRFSGGWYVSNGGLSPTPLCPALKSDLNTVDSSCKLHNYSRILLLNNTLFIYSIHIKSTLLFDVPGPTKFLISVPVVFLLLLIWQGRILHRKLKTSSEALLEIPPSHDRMTG